MFQARFRRIRVVLGTATVTAALVAATATTAAASSPPVRAPGFSSADGGTIVLVMLKSDVTPITVTGYPVPQVEEFGALPGGMHFRSLGHGAAVIDGTPDITDPLGWRTITIAAWNSAGLTKKNIRVVTISLGLGGICALLQIC
jgi:hypothetical protein